MIDTNTRSKHFNQTLESTNNKAFHELSDYRYYNIGAKGLSALKRLKLEY